MKIFTPIFTVPSSSKKIALAFAGCLTLIPSITAAEQYIRLKSLSEVNDKAYTAVAEIGVVVNGTEVTNKSAWSLHYVDSEETVAEDGAAVNAFDGKNKTYWHTKWQNGSTGQPHEIQINLGADLDISAFTYKPRAGTQENGRIANYEFYISDNGTDWGNPVATGTFKNTGTKKTVELSDVVTPPEPEPESSYRYVRLRATSEVNDKAYTAIAELNVLVDSAAISQDNWTVHYVDSEETGSEYNIAEYAIDGNNNTIWHTEWSGAAPRPPHEIQIDLGASYDINGFAYLPRQSSQENGRIADYEFFVSSDGTNWGTAVASGTFANSQSEKVVLFDGSVIVPDGPKITFGVVADCQYDTRSSSTDRQYNISDDKLVEAVASFNSVSVDWSVHLGDFIDKNYENFDTLLPIWRDLNNWGYHVLGNHDFSVLDSLKDTVPDKLSMPARYYDFTDQDWRFVVIDGNDLSLYAYPDGDAREEESQEQYDIMKAGGGNLNSFETYNGGVSSEQLAWLEQVLDDADNKGQRVILFSHFPVFPANVHNLWNAKAVVNILEDHSGVRAWFNGHNHKGNYGKRNGIHYVTFDGMVDTTENAYSIVELHDDKILVKGSGHQEDMVLAID